jgi:RNA polymerase sigma-70 factor (ECF subfamily)
MPSFPDNAGAGGSMRFDRTRWSRIIRIQAGSDHDLNELIQEYLPPLRAWLEHKLRSQPLWREYAPDILQEFLIKFCTPAVLATVKQEKGRFRTFVLKLLKREMLDFMRYWGAQKRLPEAMLESLSELDEEGNPIHDPAGKGDTPARAMDREWARRLLVRSFERLRKEAARTGHAKMALALQPVLQADDDRISYAELAKRLGMREGTLRVAAHRLRERLGEIIREEILETVSSEEDYQAELAHFISLFSPPGETV